MGNDKSQKESELEPGDFELIRKIAQKDLSAFRELFVRYQTRIYNTCYSLLADHHQAEDATQDVFLQVYKSAKSFRGESQVSSWIYRITVNRALNIIRHNRRSRWMKDSNPPWQERGQRRSPILSCGEEPDSILEAKEIKALLRETVDSLPKKQRVTFILHKHENLTSREISEILGVSINAVEARIHRAKAAIQKRFLSQLKKNS